MKVGPAMSEKIIELPKADRYDVRFEMLLRSGTRLAQPQHVQSAIISAASQTTYPNVTRAASQEVMPVPAQTLPFSETYKLYPIEGGTRAASVSAVIPYEIYAE